MNAKHACDFFVRKGLAYLDKQIAHWPTTHTLQVLQEEDVRNAYEAVAHAWQAGDPEHVKAACRMYWQVVLGHTL